MHVVKSYPPMPVAAKKRVFPQHFINILLEALGMTDNRVQRFNVFFCNKNDPTHHYVLILVQNGYMQELSVRGLYRLGTYAVCENKVDLIARYVKTRQWEYDGILKEASKEGTVRGNAIRKILAFGGGFKLSEGFFYKPKDMSEWETIKYMHDKEILRGKSIRPQNAPPATKWMLNNRVYAFAQHVAQKLAELNTN